jgi:P27 family predicted phage terminase small subunit
MSRLKSSKQKKIEGTFRKDRAVVNEVSFTPVDGVPDPPDYFGSIAKREWYALIPEIQKANSLEQVDLPQLRLYCHYIGIAEEASIILKKEGYTTTTTNKGGHSYEVQHPMLKALNEATEKVIRIAGRFGFDPASRSKVGVPPKQDADPFQELHKEGKVKKLNGVK